MAAYKRSDPKKLAADREAIARSQAEMAQPQEQKPEGLMHLFGRFITQKLQHNERRAAGFGPPPAPQGAIVLPGRRKRTVRDTSA